jgi:hypothetical protein
MPGDGQQVEEGKLPVLRSDHQSNGKDEACQAKEARPKYKTDQQFNCQGKRVESL